MNKLNISFILIENTSGEYKIKNLKVDKIEKIELNKKQNIGPYDKNSKDCLTSKELQDELQKKFPHVQVKYEINKMIDWLEAGGKTKKNYAAFARIWLTRVDENRATGQSKSKFVGLTEYKGGK